ncbi:HupE/UreJ family protein [Ruegeria pomeroyi]|uniref:HupE/UreJ family protein n=1 Tax=Ruegeria pomeroyi TaxID=89184 RepID=A0A9Q3WLZ8_9RHOB|nr:HupE/UreJ family protein [Ruegeria pomeroyi]MCE8537877.1 HupE/UreJ family protein [Ruegeria pomeroyi]
MIRLVLLLSFCLGVLLPSRVPAHALEPAFLELTPFGAGEWRVTWRKPQVQGQPMDIDAVLPEGCSPRRGSQPDFDGRAFLEGWVAHCADGIGGGEIRIEGLERSRTDVLVRYATSPEAAPQAMRLTAATPAFIVPENSGMLGVAAGYFMLGVDHILKGVDHLLFVLMLLFLIRDWRPLLAAVTSFTVAHSISLAAASLGWIVVPSPPVEAIVALSIAFLAAEQLHHRRDLPGLTLRYPWTVAFAFGLLHGLGFARALLDVGLPERDVPLALLAFNLGVEAGQVLFIAVAVAMGHAIARLYPVFATHMTRAGSFGLRSVAYAVGALASYWVIERVAGFLT